MTACFHRDHSRLMPTQKNLSNRLRAGRGEPAEDDAASAPLVADGELGFPAVAHDVCGTNIGSLSRRAEPHSACNLGIAPGLWTTTPYLVEIMGAQTFGEGQGIH